MRGRDEKKKKKKKRRRDGRKPSAGLPTGRKKGGEDQAREKGRLAAASMPRRGPHPAARLVVPVSVLFCCARHPDVTGPAEARPRGAGQAVPGPVPRACPGPDGRSVCARRPVSRWIAITMVVNGVALSSCVLLLAYHSVYSGLLARPTGLPTRCRPHGPPPRPRLCRLSRLGHTELSC